SGQFSKRCFQAELQKLLNTRDHRAATDMMMPGNGLITLAGARIQEKRRPKRTPFFFGSRFANGLEIEQILLAELEGTALPREGHDPLKHKSSQMYRYLENANLARCFPARGFAYHICSEASRRSFSNHTRMDAGVRTDRSRTGRAG